MIAAVRFQFSTVNAVFSCSIPFDNHESQQAEPSDIQSDKIPLSLTNLGFILVKLDQVRTQENQSSFFRERAESHQTGAFVS